MTQADMSEESDVYEVSCYSCEGVPEEECTEQETCDQSNGKQVWGAVRIGVWYLVPQGDGVVLYGRFKEEEFTESDTPPIWPERAIYVF